MKNRNVDIDIRNDKVSFFETLERLDRNLFTLSMTAIDEEILGEKALLSGGELIWESRPGSIFREHIDESKSITEGGMKTVGGRKVFCEVLGGKKKLVICGGGHVSMPIIRIGLMLGFSVTVLEDRPKFADNARREGATRVICDTFENALEQIKGDEDTYFVIVTRGHRYDQICLQNIVKKKHAYIGMMGSKRRVIRVKEAIIENGGDAGIVNRVHTPIGLNIGAETPEEIAVAVMGEIIQTKNSRKRNGGYPEELLEKITGAPPEGGDGKEDVRDCRALATIIARRGSAPRAVGTKMLILSDGNTVGTIGGGCAEAAVQGEAIRMIRSGRTQPELYHVDMSGADAEEEGMACGGEIDVLLEVV